MKDLILFCLLSPLCYLYAASWTTPVDLSDLSLNVEAPQVCLDDAGFAVVIWNTVQYSPDNLIQATTYGVRWSSPVDLFTNAGFSEGNPILAGNAAGNAMILATLNDGNNALVKTSQLVSGSWTSPETISAPNSINYCCHLSMNSWGDTLAAWSQQRTLNWVVQGTVYQDNSWNSPVDLSSDPELVYCSQPGLDSSVNCIAMWSTRDVNSNTIVLKASRYNAGSWSSPSIISIPRNNVYTPQFSMNSSGFGVAVWAGLTGPSWNITSARCTGGSWTSPEVISPIGRNEDSPSVAVSNNGKAIAVWQRRETIVQEIWTALFSGGSWTAPTSLFIGTADARPPKVVINDSGNAAAIWSCNDVIYASLYTAGSWSTATAISGTNGLFSLPSIAINNAGNVMAVWEKTENGKKHIQASSLGLQ